MSKKAQSSIEFILITSAVMFAFISFLFVLQNNIAEKSKEQHSLEIQQIALNVQKEIKIATEAPDGYERTFSIPEKILNIDYTITITGDSIYLATQDGKNSLSLPISKTKGQLKKGTNLIRKINGEIVLN